MSIKSFFVAALSSALDLGIATPDDVLKHVTPEVLAEVLPRPLWARLLTACVGAPKVDAQLVVETIGVSNLCEHVPAATIWRCIQDIGARSLGVSAPAIAPPPPPIVTRSSTTPAKPLAVSAPPPPDEKKPVAAAAPMPAGPSIPAPGGDPDDESTTAQPLRARTPTGQRFRQTNTNIGRLAAQSAARRPQAAVPTTSPGGANEPAAPPVTPRVRRGETDSDFEMETSVGTGNADDWKNALAVEDEQLVDWATSDETTATTDSDRYGRKR